MPYDPRTVFERYRLTARLSPELPRSDCSLLSDGLPPKDRSQCIALGCDADCRGLSVVAKAAYEKAIAQQAANACGTESVEFVKVAPTSVDE